MSMSIDVRLIDPVDLAIAFERLRSFQIVRAVRDQGFAKSPSAFPTMAEAAFDLACEEIEYRLRNEVWNLDGVAISPI